MPSRSVRKAPDDKSSATVGFLDHVGIELLRSAVVRGRMSDTQSRAQLEFEGIEAKGQSLPDGLQRCFLEGPELIEDPKPIRSGGGLHSLDLGYRKELLREFRSLQVLGVIFDVDADCMCRRPRPEDTEPAGGETEAEIR